MVQTSTLIDAEPMLVRLAQSIKPMVTPETIFIGIHSGGVWVANALLAELQIDNALATIDISFYRDDFTKKGLHPLVKSSHLPQSIDNRRLILIDDVLQTGRTIRAALNEIFSYGRPSEVKLAVLVERDGRELPIQADFKGHCMELSPAQVVKLMGPEQLKLQLMQLT